MSTRITSTYLASLLTDITGIPGVWVPLILALLGVGTFIGLSVGGRIADLRPTHALLAGALGIAAGSVLLALLARHALAEVPPWWWRWACWGVRWARRGAPPGAASRDR